MSGHTDEEKREIAQRYYGFFDSVIEQAGDFGIEMTRLGVSVTTPSITNEGLMGIILAALKPHAALARELGLSMEEAEDVFDRIVARIEAAMEEEVGG